LVVGTSAAFLALDGGCESGPSIVFPNRRFWFTGQAAHAKRHTLHALVISRGGETPCSVSKKHDYLVIGANSQPCWIYSAYGRKVEAVMQNRKEGASTIIVRERDFVARSGSGRRGSATGSRTRSGPRG
jgi:BRCT domain type II-containing protein